MEERSRSTMEKKWTLLCRSRMMEKKLKTTMYHVGKEHGSSISYIERK